MSRRRLLVLIALVVLVGTVGCAKYNTFYNAQKAFRQAEDVRKDRIKKGEDVTLPSGQQTQNYQLAIKKCQKLLEEYPGHGLTDDALFLMAKSYHRLQSFRMSVSKLDLLFQNFPSNKFMEEALYLQAANHMLIGNVKGSNDYLIQLQQQYPDSRFQAEVLRVGGDNAFTLERWDQARDSYGQYLEIYSGEEESAKVGFRLARCHWELGEYQQAHDRLEAVVASAPADRELLFKVRLLRVRCLAHLDRYDEADALADEIMPEAEIYTAQGLVVVARAENLIAQGNLEETASLLENMQDEWLTNDVKPRVGEALGDIYMSQWELELAQEKYRDAVRDVRILNDPERCKRMEGALNQYLQVEQRLDTANEDKVPGLRLIQANTLLFHFQRPDLALEVYREVSAAAETDSASAMRALYGRAVIYRDHMDLPDSSAVMIARLVDEYPNSAQAYMLDDDAEHDLYSFLMEQQRLAEKLVVAEVGEVETDEGEIEPAETPTREPGVRFSQWRDRKLRRNS